jgi:hypothetical protein
MISKTTRCEKRETLPVTEAIGASAREHSSVWKVFRSNNPGLRFQSYPRNVSAVRWSAKAPRSAAGKPKKEAARSKI